MFGAARRAGLIAVAGCVLGAALPAWAEPDVPPVTDGGATPDLAARIERLEQQNRALQQAIDQLRDDQSFDEQRLGQVMKVSGKVSGYVDVGLFWVQGDGSGIRTDIGNAVFPEYAADIPGGSWVFMGDPLATQINSRGDPADTSESRAVTFDAIHSRGKPTFIVNAVNVGLFAGIGESLTVNADFDLLPRTRIISDPNGLFLGDFLDVKLAYAEYKVPLDKLELSLFAGKFDSVLGYEYRAQESPDRLTVTPSLICRYTCGHPTGVKARLQAFNEVLAWNVAITNGSSVTEGFGFFTETDTNFFKTVSSRLSVKLPVGEGIELGISGSFGAQDAQPDDDVTHWHYGVDLHGEVADFDFTAEFVKGLAEGKTEAGGPPCGAAPCLNYRGAYGLVGYHVTNWFEPYLRGDWRHALHRDGDSFIYISDLARATVGARFDIGPSVIVKAEYTFNRELGRVPEFPDDILTSSLVLRY